MYIIMKIYSAKTDDPNGNSKILCLKHKYMYHYGRERNRNYDDRFQDPNCIRSLPCLYIVVYYIW